MLPARCVDACPADRLARVAWLIWMLLVSAAAPSAEPAPQRDPPSDPPLRDLNSHCPWQPPATLPEWESRAAALRLQLQVSLGLHPQLELPEVVPDIYGRMPRDGYSIEKVNFESLPGLYVTGNLYRPLPFPDGQRIPAVLCPHGHWNQARFYAASPTEIKNLLATGAERFESGAQNHIQARCVQLARMGCIVFHWDMLGYCDSQQISFARAHQFAQQPPESEATEEGWLLFSPRAEGLAQSVLGLQTMATQRAVDMLLTLPEVDPQRIAITGASGGGTQSFIGAALDPRIQVAFPAVMVSTGMQGGCTCENAALLRVGTSNVEIAALIAPRPLGLTAADDWTRTMPEDGFPELQRLYALYAHTDRVQLFPALHFGHNYNHVSRVSMYGWMSDHLSLGWEKPVLESDFTLADASELSVWDAEHPQPEGGEGFERRLLWRWAELVDRGLVRQLRGDGPQQASLRTTLNEGWHVVLGQTGLVPPSEQWSVTEGSLLPQGPAAAEWDFKTSEWPAISTQEQLSILIRDPAGLPRVWTARLPLGDPQSLVDNPRLAAAYTYGYNLPRFAQFSQQLGSLLAALSAAYPAANVELRAGGSHAALAAAGLFCAAPLGGVAPRAITLQLAPGNFRFAHARSIRDGMFLPAAARYWDLPGLVAALEPGRVEYYATDAETAAADFQRLSELLAWAGHALKSLPADAREATP